MGELVQLQRLDVFVTHNLQVTSDAQEMRRLDRFQLRRSKCIEDETPSQLRSREENRHG